MVFVVVVSIKRGIKGYPKFINGNAAEIRFVYNSVDNTLTHLDRLVVSFFFMGLYCEAYQA